MAITIDGDSGVSGVNGSATTPALQGTDSNTGIVFGTDTVQVATGGSTRTTVDSSGRLLVGTTSASGAGRLVVSGNTVNGEDSILTIDRGSATTSSGDTLGRINFTNGGDGVVHAAILCQTDAASGSNDNPGRILFSTTADGASSPTERMRLNSDGYLKVSTNGTFSANGTNNFYQSSTSDFGLLVGGYGVYASTVLVLEGTNPTGASFNLLQGYRAGNQTTGAGGTLSIQIAGSGNVTNSQNSYGAISDIKLKENIVDASSQWDDIKAFQVRNYNFKAETGQETQTQIGVIAQEIETVSPGLVYETADRDREGNDLGTVTKNVNYSVLYMKAVKALQEAQTRIEALETQHADLLARVTALEAA